MEKEIVFEKLKEIYDEIGYKKMKKLFEETKCNDNNFIKLIPLFAEEIICCNDFKEYYAILFLKNVDVKKIKYHKGIIISMISNPKVYFSLETLELYCRKIKENYSYEVYKEFTKEEIKKLARNKDWEKKLLNLLLK